MLVHQPLVILAIWAVIHFQNELENKRINK